MARTYRTTDTAKRAGSSRVEQSISLCLAAGPDHRAPATFLSLSDAPGPVGVRFGVTSGSQGGVSRRYGVLSGVFKH